MVGYMKLFDPAVEEARPGGSGPGCGLGSVAGDRGDRPASDEREPARARPPAAAAGRHRRRDAGGAARDARASSIPMRSGAAAPALGPLYSGILLGSVVHELAVIRAIAGDPTEIDHVETWPENAWPPSVSIVGRLGDDARLSDRLALPARLSRVPRGRPVPLRARLRGAVLPGAVPPARADRPGRSPRDTARPVGGSSSIRSRKRSSASSSRSRR